jgi:hypothetical protein
MQNNDIVLLLAAAALLMLLALIAQRRGAAARARLERVKREAELEDLGGNSYFMPPPPLEQAVELDDAVEIDSLLSGESETVAAEARRQLERTTDVDLTAGVRNLSFSLATATPPTPPVPVPLPQRRPDPPAYPASAQASAQAFAQGSAQAAAQASAPSTDEIVRVPVRELVLAWFEARGYRPAALPIDSLPIELLLRHKQTPERAYAFVAEREPLTAQRVSSLFTLARAAGFQRLLVATEGGAEPGLKDKIQRQGIRVFDEASIRAELGKIDIRVAAKIIAVARGRAATRRAAFSAAGRTAPANRPTPVTAGH